MMTLLKGAWVVGLLALTVSAFGRGGPDQYKDVLPAVQNWFKAVKNERGVPCCDLADGHRTAWRYAGDGVTFEIPDPREGHTGEWVRVPEEAVVRKYGNVVGEAVAWYDLTYSAGSLYIRCFVPEQEV